MLSVATPRPSGRAALWLSAAAVSAALAFSGALVAPAGAQAATTASYTGIVLGVGADEAQRTVSWYTSADSAQVVQVAPTSAVVNGEFVASVTTFSATGTANIATSGGYNRHATISGLQENTQYSYRVGSDGNWSTISSFKTQSFEGDFDFLFFGDPQIGSSGDVARDQAGWVDTMNVALTANPNAELLVSGGDQVETANTEAQWDAFLAPEQLRSYPWAATIGNHDVGGKAYEQHFYTPNTDYSADYYRAGNTATESGGDYWYIYKDVLFIDLNSNSYNDATGGGDEAHVQYVTDVVNAHGADAKYTVLVYHHSIYSAASHAKDADNKVRRVDFPTTFSKLGVDLVLQGHDHVYTRSYEIKDGEKANADEQPGANDVFVGEGGVIYMTANSASGSKYYDITAPDNSGTSGAGNGADPLNPESYWYNSVQNQEHVRSYVKVQVKADALVVEGIRSGTCDAPNAAVELGKVGWCGTEGSTTPVGGVGSVIDSVTIHQYHADGGEDLQVIVPTAAPGEFGWTIDGQNGLVDLGTAEEKDGYFEASGEINPIAVSDTRSSLAPWSLTSVLGDFSDGDKSFSGSYLGWTPKVLTAGAGAVAGAAVTSGFDGGAGLSVDRVLGAALQGHDKGEALLGADLDLKLPTETKNGSYRATLTITALAG